MSELRGVDEGGCTIGPEDRYRVGSPCNNIANQDKMVLEHRECLPFCSGVWSYYRAIPPPCMANDKLIRTNALIIAISRTAVHNEGIGAVYGQKIQVCTT